VLLRNEILKREDIEAIISPVRGTANDRATGVAARAAAAEDPR
jgi:hypothetical protein